MKSAKPTNGKKVSLKLKDLEVTPKKDPRGGVKVTRPFRNGLQNNHNELFLAEVSRRKEPSKRSNGKTINLKLKDLSAKKDPRGGMKRIRDGLNYNHNELFLADLS
jgi:hypothetical protein